jgi:hypothetical protein
VIGYSAVCHHAGRERVSALIIVGGDSPASARFSETHTGAVPVANPDAPGWIKRLVWATAPEGNHAYSALSTVNRYRPGPLAESTRGGSWGSLAVTVIHLMKTQYFT